MDRRGHPQQALRIRRSTRTRAHRLETTLGLYLPAKQLEPSARLQRTARRQLFVSRSVATRRDRRTRITWAWTALLISTTALRSAQAYSTSHLSWAPRSSRLHNQACSPYLRRARNRPPSQAQLANLASSTPRSPCPTRPTAAAPKSYPSPLATRTSLKSSSLPPVSSSSTSRTIAVKAGSPTSSTSPARYLTSSA